MSAKTIENKFSKTLDEDTISRIRASCDCDRGNWETKIASKKIKRTFSIFSAAIFVTQFPPSRSQDPQIHNIVSSSNIFENLPIAIAGPSNLRYCVFVSIENFKFSKLLMGEIGWRKSQSKKSKRRFNFFCCDFRHPTTYRLPHSTSHLPTAIITGPSMGDENSPKRIKNVVKSKTSLVWLSPPPIAIALLNRHQTFLGIYSSQYQIRGSSDYDDAGRVQKSHWQGVEKNV